MRSFCSVLLRRTSSAFSAFLGSVSNSKILHQPVAAKYWAGRHPLAASPQLEKLQSASNCEAVVIRRGNQARSSATLPGSEGEKKGHWTDGKLGQVLQEQNRKLWLKGMQERLRNLNIPPDTQHELPAYLDAAFLDMAKKYQYLVSDERSSVHLQTACLILATHKVVLPFVRNEEEMMEILKMQMGNATSPVLRYVLKTSMYFTPDAFASTAMRLHSLRSDLGGAVDANVVESSEEARLEIYSCLYNTVFASENKSHLADCCCCSVDSKMWFDGLDSFGVQCSLEDRLPEGGTMCCLMIRKKVP